MIITLNKGNTVCFLFCFSTLALWFKLEIVDAKSHIRIGSSGKSEPIININGSGLVCIVNLGIVTIFYEKLQFQILKSEWSFYIWQ